MDKIYEALKKVEEKIKPQDKNQISSKQDLTPALSIKVKDQQMSIKEESSNKVRKRQKDLFTMHDSGSFIAEQFRVIRNSLLRDSKYSHIRTILVTSALPNEGKTMVASNFAISMAQVLNQRVLLVDADLRKPSMHDLFNIRQEGLCEYLLKKGSDDLLNETDNSELLVMSSGVCPEDPAELLSLEKITGFIGAAKSSYKDCYIIFDSSPVQLFSELITLAEVVDGILLVAKAGETKRKIVENTVNILRKEKVIGVVLNNCKATPKEYSNYQNIYQRYQKKINK